MVTSYGYPLPLFIRLHVGYACCHLSCCGIFHHHLLPSSIFTFSIFQRALLPVALSAYVYAYPCPQLPLIPLCPPVHVMYCLHFLLQHRLTGAGDNLTRDNTVLLHVGVNFLERLPLSAHTKQNTQQHKATHTSAYSDVEHLFVLLFPWRCRGRGDHGGEARDGLRGMRRRSENLVSWKN